MEHLATIEGIDDTVESLVDDEELGPDVSVGAVWFSVVGNLVTHAGSQRKDATVFQLGVELAVNTEENVPLDTPVVCQIARRVFDHADANGAECTGSPVRNTAFALVLGRSTCDQSVVPNGTPDICITRDLLERPIGLELRRSADAG